MKKIFSIVLVLAIALFFGAAYAMEHPGEKAAGEHPGEAAGHKEHPGSTHEAEHPGKTSEHPPHGVAPGEKATTSAEKVIKGIKFTLFPGRYSIIF